MRLVHALSETFIGRALISDFLDLPRWTLANLLFAIALLPAFLAMTNGLWAAVGIATLPSVPVFAGMINMAASHTAEKKMRLRDAFAYRSTLFAVFVLWLPIALVLTLIFAGISTVVLFAAGIAMLFLLVIGVFAVYLPSQLKVVGLLIWRNALVLAVSYPIVGFGLLALAGVSVWLVAISKGALIVVLPSLWVVIAAFTVNDQIKTMQSKHAG